MSNVTLNIERIEHYCNAHEMKSKRKLSMLLSAIGPEAYEILKVSCSPTLIIETTYEEIKLKLIGHFGSRYIEIVERYRFHLIRKSNLQTVQEFVSV